MHRIVESKEDDGIIELKEASKFSCKTHTFFCSQGKIFRILIYNKNINQYFFTTNSNCKRLYYFDTIQDALTWALYTGMKVFMCSNFEFIEKLKGNI